ncbi:MAG TPA: hypothetical protein VFE90_16485 [Myxococcales bacterium]|jgi:hypothetical protein|nr:hypothetical protein [Myxococcales bacterium]
MLRANHAVRLGLRAASRNPELAFGKALLDEGGSLLALLPVGLAALLFLGAARRNLVQALLATLALGWTAACGMAVALVIAFTVSMLFWAGAVPVLAADAELGRRPPAGNFLLLLSRGAARVMAAGLLGFCLSLLVALSCGVALTAAAPLLIMRPSVLLFCLVALAGAGAVLGSVLLDLLARLTLVRAAAFGDGVTAAFGKAASLLAARLGGCLLITGAFLLLELIAATVAGMLTGLLPGFLDPKGQLMALGPRLAVSLAAAAVFAWLEVARMGALAALAADAEGLIDSREPESPPIAEVVVEALPVDDSLNLSELP